MLLEQIPAATGVASVPTETYGAIVALFASMVGILVFLVRTFVTQNKELVDRFITTNETVIGKNTQELVNVGRAITENTTTLREHIANSREEHGGLLSAKQESDRRVLDAIGKIGRSRLLREELDEKERHS